MIGKKTTTPTFNPYAKTRQQVTDEILLALSTATKYKDSTCGLRVINAINRYLLLTRDTEFKNGERFASTAMDALKALELIYQGNDANPESANIDAIIGQATHLVEQEYAENREIASDLKRDYIARQVSTDRMKAIEQLPEYKIVTHILTLERLVKEAGK